MEKQAYEEMARCEKAHWWFQGRREIIRAVLKKKLPNKSHRILEVGAGTGGNYELLREFGKVDMLEPSSEGRRFINQLENIPNDVELLDLSLPEGPKSLENKYDLVVMFDVLEHIEQASESLESLKDVLVPHGRVAITVPAYQFMWSTHDVALHHQRRYTKAKLRKDIEAAGYEVDYISYFNTFLFPLAWLTRSFDKLTNSTEASGIRIPSPPINTTLRNVFLLEAKLLPSTRMPFGLSLIALASPK